MPRSVHMAVMMTTSLVMRPGKGSHSAKVHDVAGGVHDAQAAPAWTRRGRDRRPMSAPPVIAGPQEPEWHHEGGPRRSAKWHSHPLAPKARLQRGAEACDTGRQCMGAVPVAERRRTRLCPGPWAQGVRLLVRQHKL